MVTLALSVFLAWTVAPSLVHAQACHLVSNAGFESDLTGWINSGTTTIVSDPHSGTKAARVGLGQGGVNHADLIPVTAGQQLTFQVWAKVAGAPAWAGVGLDFLDATGTETSQISLPITSTAYALVSATQAVPAGATNVRVWTWKTGSVGYLFLDDFDICVGSASDAQPPSVPSGLAASSVTATGFTLRWNASSDNVGVSAYQVLRDGKAIGTRAAPSWNVTGLGASTSYVMTVRAVDAAGNWSAASAPLSVTTLGGGQLDITINKATQFQTMAGFGFFGAQDVWWASPSSLWSDAWGDQVISDLGITIWRNEYYPPADQYGGQDADWNKQLPVVRGLKAKADHYGVKLKFIFTVWSPPSSMKVAVVNGDRAIGTPNPSGTKGGGALDPGKYAQFASWLQDGIRLYQNEGINLYAFSPQNEPFFFQGFNSCFYKQEWYPQMLIGAIPAVRAAFPNVKVFGSENMLEMEAADNNWQWFYHKQILDSPQASSNIDILAVHGYLDGVAPTSGSQLSHLWANHKLHFGDAMGKPQWMTETSGYADSWTGSPGAFSLALDMMAGLNFGNMTGWVAWQGSQNPGSTSGIGSSELMNGLVKGKKYYVSKQFYRYIRPGAVRVGATSTNANVTVSAFQHTAQGTATIVLANSAASAQAVTVGGAGLPPSFEIFRTSATDNAVDAGVYATGSILMLPARSIVTLQAGGTPLATVE